MYTHEKKKKKGFHLRVARIRTKKFTFKNESYTKNQDQFLYWKQWIY